MKLLLTLASFCYAFLVTAQPTFAATSEEVTNFSKSTLDIITLLASSVSVLFLIKAGYLYVTSTGKPEGLDQAKKTMRNALVGLVIVLSANALISIFSQALTSSAGNATQNQVAITPIEPVTPTGGMTQVLIDAIAGFLQTIIESATKPLFDAVIGFLSTTPSVLNNSVIMNFWLVILGITDTLFVLAVALMGLQVMSASTFGFEEVEVRQLLPRLGLAFLLAHISLFLADYVIQASNALVKAVLDSTGGLHHAWITNAFNPEQFAAGNTPIITLIFMLLFVIVTIVLLLFYISRLIMIALAATLSPLIFLLWVLPKFSDFAEIAIKSYIVTVFSVFVHVVIIQLASSFLTIPDQANMNPLISVLIATGMFFTLLKTPSLMMQFVMYTSRNGAIKKMSNQIINVITTSSAPKVAETTSKAVKTPRRVINA